MHYKSSFDNIIGKPYTMQYHNFTKDSAYSTDHLAVLCCAAEKLTDGLSACGSMPLMYRYSPTLHLSKLAK